jgi:hypothetical protein
MSRYDWPGSVREKEEKDKPAARLAFTRRRHREFDPEGALRARSGTQQPEGAAHPPGPFAPATGRVHLWQPLGPVTLLKGQAEGNPRVSGRVNAICVHDAGLRAYAASANGGVWYTRDGGANWVSVAGLASTDTAGILRPAQRNACGALHVIFGTAEGEDLVFLGTGELTGLSQLDLTGQPASSEAGIGILVGDRPMRSNQPDPWQREAPNLVNNGVFRIVQEPGGNTVIAATRTGLFQRPASPAANRNWERLSFEPFNTLEADCTDLLWTPAVGTSPPRLWVWVMNGPDFGLWVRATGTNGDSRFNKVAVDPVSGLSYAAFRASLAASTPASQVWVLNDRGAVTNPALFRVTNPAAGTAPVAHGVTGVPNILRDQGFYDIAIAVDPAHPNRVTLAGSFLGDPNVPADILLVTTPDGATRGYDASIVFADVAPDPANGGVLAYGLPATPYTMIGIGVHPDVHALVYSNGGSTLWTGCDGGIFRSDRPTSRAGFYPRNNGMSISESNYLAHHPNCEGHLIAGLQDNGTIVRLSSAVWKRSMPRIGDGGGVVIDPTRPDRSLAQSTQGRWRRSAPGGGGPAINKTEREAAAFYSSAASIEHVRTAPPAPPIKFSQTILGTNRLWYSDDFGATWRTLPAGTNPLIPPILPNQDKLPQAITVCRWQSPDVAWALCEQLITRYARTPGSHNPSGPGTWISASLIPPGFTPSGKAKKRPPAPPSLSDSRVWTDIAVNLEPPGLGLPPAQRGTLGALYIGTVGHPDKPNVDTLWWFDGTDKWYPTGLRTDPRGVPAPVTAIVCDPLSPTEVWVGTTVGVWHGIRTDHGASSPTWEWNRKVNGLPEAAVEDLSLFRAGTLVILRAAIAARGLWELRLDAADVQERTYLRAHDDDLRHRARAVETQRDGTTPRSWHGSPDVRPRLAPALVPAPASLRATPWQRSTFPGTTVATEQLRRFQAALRSSIRTITTKDDPRIVANGVWDGYFSEVLRDHGAPTVAVPAAPPLPALNVVEINEAFWNLHMQGAHATAEPWNTSAPGEADLYELTPRLEEGNLDSTSCSLPARDLRVDIVVHHRGMDVMDGANVRVTLLWWTAAKSVAKWNDAMGRNPPRRPWAPAVNNVPWTAIVNQVLNNDAKPDPDLGSGWKFALGDENETHLKTLAGQMLDPMHSGIATFNLNLSALVRDRVVLLVAVIRAGLPAPAHDIALAPATLPELVLTSPNVAVRSLRISP